MEDVRSWLCNPENAFHCEGCPENQDFSSWPGTRLPCGQFHCWVSINTADDDEDE